MGKIKKAASPKHESSLSPALAEFVQNTVTVPLAQLPAHLSSFPKRWLFPRGDLFHWIQPLNRFDDILEKLILHYQLNAGPQVKSFGVSYLRQEIPHEQPEDLDLFEAGYSAEGDRELAESILRFTKLLLEKCGNRSLYASSERLNDFLNTTSLSLLNATLRLSLCLAQRHSGRQRSRPPTAQYAISASSLLALCSPLENLIPQGDDSGTSPAVVGSRSSQRNSNGTSIVNEPKKQTEATTLRILALDAISKDSDSSTEWLNVELTFNSTSDNDRPLESRSSDPIKDTNRIGNLNSPSPLRRTSSDPDTTLTAAGPAEGMPQISNNEHGHKTESQTRKVSISSSTILGSSIEEVMQTHLAKIPTSHQYDFLSRVRTAYGIASQRQELVASRLLAISNLAYILPEAMFEVEVLRKDNELPKDQQLPYVLSSLVHPPSRGLQISTYLRTLAINTLKALAKHKAKVNDIFAALGANVSHGTLHITLRETLASLQSIDDKLPPSDDDLDEFRDTVFSLVRSLLVDSSQTSRSGEVLSSPSFVSTYNELLKIQTENAERLYLRAFEFFDALCQYMKDGLSILFNNGVFESLIGVFNREVTSSLDLAAQRRGVPVEYRVASMDYYIPYVKQQIIKFMLPFIDKVLGQHNPIVDRILRSLIDDAAFLKSLRLIIENNKSFGGHIWAGAIKVLGSFLHNEPTSYSVIAEAGLSKAFLEAVTAQKRSDGRFKDPSEPLEQASDGELGSQSGHVDVEMSSNNELPPNPQQMLIHDSDILIGSHSIPPSTEAIFNVAQAFEAICLTNSGFELFQRSSAMKDFFSIFESSAHVKVMQSAQFLTNLGNVFDEFVRHHPALRDAVLSAVLVAVARLRYLCLSKVWSTGEGSKLWYNTNGSEMEVAGGRASASDYLDALHSSDSPERKDNNQSLDLPTGDKLVIEDGKESGKEYPNRETENEEPTVTDYISCLMLFLSGLFENQGLCNSYMEAGGTELVLDFTILPSLPHDFTRKKGDGSNGPLEIAQVLHCMAENKPHLVIPSLLDRCLRTVRHLETIVVDFARPESLFKSFLDSKSEPSSANGESSKAQPPLERGTTLVKCMTNINVLVACMQEIFAPPLYHTRQSSQPSPFLQLNVADMYIEICSKLGRLQSFCLKEELMVENEASDSWKAAVRIDETGKEAEDLKKAMEMLRRHSSHGEDMADDAEQTPALGVAESRSDTLHQEPGYRNYVVLGHLTKHLSTNISKWFQCLAQSLVPKRRMEPFQKQNAFNIAAALGEVLVYQLKPPFFMFQGAYFSESLSSQLKYQYLDRVLSTLWEVTMGDNTRPQSFTNAQASCVTSVMVAFKNAHGLSLLREITEICYSELIGPKEKTIAIGEATRTHASQCLGSVLSYCEQATSARCVIESPQSQYLKNPDRERPHPFLPAQLLVELRMELLPTVRKVWDNTQDADSFLIRDGPRSMLEAVVHSLRHVLEGDCENEAHKSSSDLEGLPAPPPFREFTIAREKYSTLKGEYDKDLAREALYRCNNNLLAAQEYCKSFTRWFRESRNPPPVSEPAAKSPEEQGSPARNVMSSNQDGQSTSLPTVAGTDGQTHRDGEEDGPSTSLDNPEAIDNHDIVGGSVDDELDSVSSDMSVDEPAPRASTNGGQVDRHEHSSSILEEETGNEQAPKVHTVEDLDAQRERIRYNLVDQCLNVLNEQNNISFELSDLVLAASKKLLGSDAAEYRENSGQLVVHMLTSLQDDLQSDNIAEDQRLIAGKKIAACAHFLALLLQDKSMYENCLEHLKTTFPTLVGFVKIAPSNGGRKDEDSSPWVAQVLLIVEKMLSDDSEPQQIQWTPPSPDGSVEGGPIVSAEPRQIVSSNDKTALFEAIIEILPKIGKDQSLALSTARVLVILTRTRQLAVRLAEKRNLQRLFLMVKQLTYVTNDGLQSALMITLRHIVEDRSTLLQIMKSEIVANFDNRSSRSATDTTQYLRHMAHLVIRSPEVFVEATNATLKLQRYEGHPRSQALILRPDAKKDTAAEENQAGSSQQDGPPTAAGQADAVAVADQNTSADTTLAASKSKASESKAPFVENPDGLIHYLVSELLSYKDVEDKDSSNTTAKESSKEVVPLANGHASPEVAMSTAESTSSSLPVAQRPHSDTIRFKTEDHPIFTYRCFILQCLTELLYSYNRAKIEFINFSRKSDPTAFTPSKPRGTVLNYLLNNLVPVTSADSTNSLSSKKKSAVSEWASKVIIALCSKTGELGIVVRERFASGSTAPRIVDNDDEQDLSFVRRFVLEHAMRAFQGAAASSEPLDIKHARLLGLAELFQKLIQKPTSTDASCGANNQSYQTLAKMMIEKNFIQMITSSVADIDLSSSGSKRVIKYILKPLEYLTGTAASLSQQASISFSPAFGQIDQDDNSSASAVSEMDNEREQTPDLFRHSTLGMLEPSGEDESSSDEDEDDEDADEVYDDEYDGMDYEDEMQPTTADDGEVISDEEADEMGRGTVEGIPGDVPMDIELVMEDDGMDEDSDDEGDEDDDEMDDDEEDDDEEDFDGDDDIEIEDEDPIVAGEINGDEENASLGDMDEGDGWESEEGVPEEIVDEDSQDFQNAMDNVGAVMAGEDPVVEDVQSGLDELLQIVGNEQTEEDQTPAEGMWPPADPATLFDQAQASEGADYDEDLEDPDEDEDGLSYHEDNFVFDANDDIPWGWENDEPPPIRSHHHRHRHHIHHGRHAGFFSNLLGQSDLYPRQAPRQSHRDDGTNPLLRRTGISTQPQSSISFPAIDMLQEFRDIGQELSVIPGISGRHDVMEAIISAVGRGERTIEVTRSGREYGLRIAQMPRHHRPMTSIPGHPSGPFPPSLRDDPQQVVNFSSLVTGARWGEEAKLLCGNNCVEKASRVTNALLKVLVPPAIEEEKARQKELEEDRKREAEEKAEKERQARIAEEEAEKKRKEEEQEAARRAEETMAQEVAATANSERQEQDQPTSDGQSNQDTQANATNVGQAPTAPTDGPNASASRVYTNIRGRNIDITEMSIDAEYLEALPEEFREEVIMRQYAEQRHQAEEQGQAASDINREFLDALPEDIREELLQQEAQERRQRERDAARRRAAESGSQARAEEMDTDSFLASLDPALRRSILADSPEEVLQTMAPQFVAEARSMMGRTLNQFGRLPIARDVEDSRHGHEQMSSKDAKRQVVQMIDKSGVATLLRLMFMPLQGSTKPVLWALLHHICQHRQTRAEVINLLLLILQDGSADVSAVERSLSHLSIRAKTPAQKPPQPLKRTLSLPAGQSANFEVTPLVVVQQCLSALQALNLENPNVAIGFLRETDSATNSRVKTKGKVKDDKANRFALNALLGLLNRPMITENSTCMEVLSRILANITHALHRVLKSNKPEDKPKEAPGIESGSEQLTSASQSAVENSQDQTDPTDSAAPASSVMTDLVDTVMASASAQGHTGDNASAVEQSTEATTNEGPSTKPEPATSSEKPTPKPEKTFEPPVIPESNLRYLVGVVAARECNSKIFRETISTMMNISLIPETKEVFGKELIRQAQGLCITILSDLDGLLKSLRTAKDGLELQSIVFSKFTPAGSDQTKLLRVLTALDYLFDPKRQGSKDKQASPSLDEDKLLPMLYESPEFGQLWSKVGECLTTIRQKDNMVSVATILQHLIEALMVVCKNTSLRNMPVSRPGLDTPSIRGNQLETLFFNFTEEHRKILNDLVRQNPKLMSGSFAVLIKNPKVLDFDNKLSYFRKRIRTRDGRHPQPPLQLSIRRNETFLDSFKSLYFKSAEEIKFGKLSIRFHGEEGVDAGGVTREWFQVLARGMFNPDYALFIPVASDRTTFHPNRLSGVNEEHLLFFKFIGRIIGKALYEGRVLDCHFSRAVYKRILGKTVSLKDMETLDLDYYKSLVWMLENDITDIITENFSVESADFGENRTIDLIPNGRNIPVTDENKQEYVQLVVEYRLTESIKEQLENFLKGFYEIIPAEIISIFNEQELELLISGLPDIDIDDWKANTEYHTYNASSAQIQWFWRAVRSFDKEEQAKLLQFVTGTSKVPLNGFKELEGMNGFSKFNIHKDYGNKDRLPSSHTCFNQLDLPEYDDYETLRERLYMAMTTGSEYFGFA
ncbi:MAG: hypothetical protein Q9160_000130 [Pyrenula sp. 1 TL-2023]